ncbi:Zinc/iron permease [Polychaeton citri CBS 116435]|uniref:Zinc/iron permease n=1 Tax=Polychaeton citri CBS 116435 TaxID=1314669 RepID=A0A9P4Q2S9_9PEZI|nr:Zinc/iron permease [Polychaeton citri CBS 116435]
MQKQRLASGGPPPLDYASWSDIPSAILHHELARRAAASDGQQTTQSDRPECGSGSPPRHYNTPLHVFALFLILVLSTAACSFPVIAKRFPSLPIPKRALFVSRHFGTGVLLATAFVHLLPTAYMSLTDRCLPAFWNEGYPAMPGFIAMTSVLVVVGIEMFFATKGAAHSHGSEFTRLASEEGEGQGQGHGHGHGHGHAQGQNSMSKPWRPASIDVARARQGGQGLELQGQPASETSPFADSPPNSASSLNKPLPPEPRLGDDSDSEEDLDFNTDEMDPLTEGSSEGFNESTYPQDTNGHSMNGKLRRHVSFADSPDYAPSPSPPSQSTAASPNEQRLVLQCLLLEAGILFHSVFIGMALSVSTGPAFIVLLIAISFHQTFEGLALGSRIASIDTFAPSSPKPWLMSFLYGITTPIGQAIGLAVHNLYDPASQTGLLMVGTVNAISSGLLLYAGLVQLLAEDFLSDHSYVELKGRRRLEACAAVVGGSMLMALVGAWA